MEYDDRFNSVETNDFINSNQNQLNALSRVQSLNRGYHKLARTVLINNRNKKIELGVYGSGSHESQIRNAETGEYYKYKVGTMDEDLFFKAMISTGEVPSGPLTLFYDSPSQYENHQLTKVSTEVKQNWLKKSLKAQQRLNM